LRQGTGARLGRDWRRWRGGFCSFSVLAGPDTGLMAKKAFAARPGARLTRALRAPRGGALALARMRGSYEDNSEEPFVLPPRKKKSGNAGFERQRRLRVSLWDRCPQVDRDTPQTPVGGAINGQWPTPPNSRGRSYQWPMANTPKLPWEELSMADMGRADLGPFRPTSGSFSSSPSFSYQLSNGQCGGELHTLTA